MKPKSWTSELLLFKQKLRIKNFLNTYKNKCGMFIESDKNDVLEEINIYVYNSIYSASTHNKKNMVTVYKIESS